MDTPGKVVRRGERTWSEGAAPEPFGRRYAWKTSSLSRGQGLRRLGAHLEQILPGKASCQLHFHLREEEHFVVLAGELTVREQWPGTEGVVEYSAKAGDLLVYLPGTGVAHQFRNDGPTEVSVLAASRSAPGDVCVYPETARVLMAELRRNIRLDDASVARLRGDARTSRPVEPLVRGLRAPHGHRQAIEFGAAWPGRGLRVVAAELAPGGSTEPSEPSSSIEELLWVRSGELIVREHVGGEVVDTVLRDGDVISWSGGARPAYELLNGGSSSVDYVAVTEKPHAEADEHDDFSQIPQWLIEAPGDNVSPWEGVQLGG